MALPVSVLVLAPMMVLMISILVMVVVVTVIAVLGGKTEGSWVSG